jgi:predicted Zn-dependent protease
MKRWLPLACIVLAGIAAIFIAERHKVDTRPSADAILTATADAQHEVTRVPARFDRMSDADEVRVGDELAAEYAQRWKPTAKEAPAAAEIERYLQSVGERTAAGAERKLPYRFHYIPDPSFVNAFALPGGHVFVGRGLLALMTSEDALAAVLGHEVEHINLRHCAERVQTEAHLRDLGALGDLLGLPVEIFEAGYSKDQELQADRYGTALAVKAGYSPQGILDLFGEFAKLEQASGDGQPTSAGSPVGEAAQVSLSTLEGYFRSHPSAAQRTEQITRLARTEGWPRPPLRPLQVHALVKP